MRSRLIKHNKICCSASATPSRCSRSCTSIDGGRLEPPAGWTRSRGGQGNPQDHARAELCESSSGHREDQRTPARAQGRPDPDLGGPLGLLAARRW
jgi:hypothetical protein